MPFFRRHWVNTRCHGIKGLKFTQSHEVSYHAAMLCSLELGTMNVCDWIMENWLSTTNRYGDFDSCAFNQFKVKTLIPRNSPILILAVICWSIVLNGNVDYDSNGSFLIQEESTSVRRLIIMLNITDMGNTLKWSQARSINVTWSWLTVEYLIMSVTWWQEEACLKKLG